ncbi:MAG: S1C family serine protease, partial [Gaiellales bacterium]
MDDSPAAQIAPTSRSFPRLGASIRRLGPFGAGVLAALAAIVAYGVLFPGQPPLSQRQVNDSIAQALASQTPAPALSQQAYVVIQPSLVLIQTEPAAGATAATAGLGSGVIIDDRGDILTSLHVVADAATIELTFADGTRSTATISVRRPDQDTAVLLADHPPAGLAPATLGSPGAVRVGSDAFVVGNPFGLYASMSAGVVSGLHRTFQMPDGGPILRELIQVDAAVNPGNSGGPLLDRDGRVIGIVAALINPTNEDVFVGIGLAVPIDAAGGAAGLPQY